MQHIGREFIKTQRLPVEYHRYLINAQEKRTEADYSLNPNITSEQVQAIIDQAQIMLDFAFNNFDST